MQLLVFCSDVQKKELGQAADAGVIYVSAAEEFLHYRQADAFLDLLFEPDEARIRLLEQLLPQTVIVHSVETPLARIHPQFVRINAWPTFLAGPVVEAACADEQRKEAAVVALALFGKRTEWLPDEPGFVTARVICMIINEAYFAFSEGVASRQDIDTALKLGVAYPFGPFEWAQKIGLNRVLLLLQRLSGEEARYCPSPLLAEEAAKGQSATGL